MDAPTPLPIPIDEALMRDALLGAGTSVWEWHIPSDRLSDIGTSAALLGYAPGELASEQASWNGVIHPDDLPANEAAYERHARGEVAIYESEYRARARDGGWRWISERGRIVERAADGSPLRMVGTLSDVTARRGAQDAALALADRLQAVVRHVPGVVYQYRARPDGSGEFAYFSDSSQALFGVSPAQAMADPASVMRRIEREDRERVFAELLVARRAMRIWRCEFRVRNGDRQQRWVSLAASPMPEPRGAVLWHGYIEDITELRELERTRELATAAQAASRAKTEFLSRISHELRTPLNAVLGFAQLLELDASAPLTATQAQRVALIREAGGHLLEMIGELLDLTGIEAGRMTLAIEPLPVAPLMRDCVAMLQPQAQAAGVSLQAILPDAGCRVRADPTRLRQVLINLIGNAIKYNRPGGSVRVSCEGVAAQVQIEVRDTGVGIAAADLPRLFEPFNRLAHDRSTIEGTGVGLAVTRGLVDLMHGTIAVESTPGVGSSFRVALPAEPTS